ncbi:hypothetical protein EYC80_001542 [Monilinia laxa]|uniref:Uncharacterized protein n=1 Tax=Monilinia laxa TaxID=61186 RepID=A0A5N6K5D7_MONLA|nr:hypothetical protein EYC80_001542 [Monilinia laxa]
MASEAKPFLPRTTNSNEDYDVESDNTTKFRSPISEYDWKRSCIQILPTFFLASALGFFLGHNSVTSLASKPTYGGLLPPDGNVTQIWEHNLTFSQAPTAESEAAWDSYVPPGRGFIHQPDIAPFISNIAVFHQLHCFKNWILSEQDKPTQRSRISMEPKSTQVICQSCESHNQRMGTKEDMSGLWSSHGIRNTLGK